jgi:dTDP-4-dehydrorhamnose reductase
MKYCVFGASGQVGERLAQILEGRFFSHQGCDITNIEQVRDAVKGVDWVVNAAAFTSVDKAEENRQAAKRVNDYGVKILAQVCVERRLPLCHFSTDQIFSGFKHGEVHRVAAEPSPVNYYGISKLRGEKHVKRLPRYLIIRTSWVYGGANSFVKKILSQIKEKEIFVVADQFSRPTFAKDLAQATETLIEAGVVGAVHFANLGWCSKAEWAEEIIRMLGLRTVVQPVSSKFFKTPATRPKWSVLDVLDLPFLLNRHWRYALAEYLRELGYWVE